MRLLSAALVFLGIIAIAAGAVAGCGSFFSWNGRHAVAVHAIEPGTPLRVTFPTSRETRYTAGIQVVYAREGLPVREGALVVASKLPLVARMRDDVGMTTAEAVGWIDPSEPPTVLYGQAAKTDQRARAQELFAERLVGPWPCARAQTAVLDVDLGADKSPESETRILAARAVIYDDGLPASVKGAFGAAGGGFAAMLLGIVSWVVAARRRPR